MILILKKCLDWLTRRGNKKNYLRCRCAYLCKSCQEKKRKGIPIAWITPHDPFINIPFPDTPPTKKVKPQRYISSAFCKDKSYSEK